MTVFESPIEQHVALGQVTLSPGQPLLASPVFWRVAARELPDSDITVLLYLENSGEIWTGYHAGDRWRFFSADRIEEPVLYWADFPAPPIG